MTLRYCFAYNVSQCLRKNDIDRLAIQPHVTGTMGGKRAGSHCRFLFCHLDYPIDAQVRNPFPLIPRIEGFRAGQPPMSMVGALCCPTRSHKQRRQTGYVRHCQTQESQSTDLMVPVGVKAPLQKHLQVGVQLCGRPMLVVWVLV